MEASDLVLALLDLHAHLAHLVHVHTLVHVLHLLVERVELVLEIEALELELADAQLGLALVEAHCC